MPLDLGLRFGLGAERQPIHDFATQREQSRQGDGFPEQGHGGEDVKQGIAADRGLRAGIARHVAARPLRAEHSIRGGHAGTAARQEDSPGIKRSARSRNRGDWR